MSTVTIKDLQALEPGKKINDLQQMYWRKNADGTVSAYQRVKTADGKWKDERAARLAEFTRHQIGAARLAAARLRGAAVDEADALPEPAESPALVLNGQTTLAHIWPDFFRDVQVGEAWTGKNVKVNRLRVEKHLMTTELWAAPISEIKPHHLKTMLLPLRMATPDQERKVRGILSKLFTHAIGLKLIDVNPVPTALALMNNTSKAKKSTPLPAITDVAQLRELLGQITAMNGHGSVRNALFFQAFTAQRSEEVAGALWREFDFKTGRWTIDRQRMKIKDETRPDQELVLPPKLMEWLQRLPRRGAYVFADARGEDKIATGSLDKSMRETLGMAGKHVPHGWRSALKTRALTAIDANGRPMFAKMWVDAVTDHAHEGIDKHYVREQAVQGGGQVLAWWADQLGAL